MNLQDVFDGLCLVRWSSWQLGVGGGEKVRHWAGKTAECTRPRVQTPCLTMEVPKNW